MTPKDKAVMLLRAAAEVEHQFIVQYLYAHYCGGQYLKDQNRGALMTIAQEEMGHLLTAQNLLAIVGESFHLDRMEVVTPEEEPSPFRLEPLILPFIARFLVSESSANAQLPTDIDQHLPSGLALQQIHRVGAIYALLYWLFQSDDGSVGPWNLSAGMDTTVLEDLGHLSDDDLADVPVVNKAVSAPADWPGAVAGITNPRKDILVISGSPKGFADKTEMRAAALSAIHTVAGQPGCYHRQPDSG
jgi:hypothetical protein